MRTGIIDFKSPSELFALKIEVSWFLVLTFTDQAVYSLQYGRECYEQFAFNKSVHMQTLFGYIRTQKSYNHEFYITT